jgi:F5/8 type C domain
VEFDLDMDASLISPIDVPLPVSLCTDAKATDSNVYQNQSAYSANMAVDGDPATRRATDTGTFQSWLQVDLGQAKAFGRTVIYEAYPGRVTSCEIQWSDGAQWQTFWTGTTLGAQWSESLTPITMRLVRLNILNSTDRPTIWRFQLF